MTLRTGSRWTGARAGFTLVELAIVIFILATLLAIAAPSFVRSYNSAQLSAAARSLSTACQLARLQAALQQRPAELHLDLDGQAYWVEQRQLIDGSEQQVVIQRLDLPQQVTMTSAQLPDERLQKAGELTVHFYPNGTCEAVTVVLHGSEKGTALAVMVDPITARADVTAVK